MKRYVKADIVDIHDEDERLKIQLASAPDTPIRTLLKLATDYDEYVREEVAKRPDLPMELQEILLKDRLACVKRELAHNPTIATSIMEALANDKDWRVTLALGFNENLPEYLIRKLVDIAPISIASNPSTPADVLRQLSVHEDYDVRRYVIYNRSTPLGVLEDMYKNDINEDLRQSAIHTHDIRAKNNCR